MQPLSNRPLVESTCYVEDMEPTALREFGSPYELEPETLPQHARFDEEVDVDRLVREEDEEPPTQRPVAAPRSAATGDDPCIGRVLSGRYRVMAKLGHGPMGAVYLAEQVLLERRVEIKVLSEAIGQNRDAVVGLVQLAKAVSRLGHAGVVDVTDLGSCADGSAYIVSEHLVGIALAQRIAARGPLSFGVARGIVLQLCSALSAGHDRGIVHGELNPQNVFLTTVGSHGDVVKLIDLGVANIIVASGVHRRLVASGVILGTPAYRSPEQSRGEIADVRSDVYALGCVMYEMLTGCVPFVAPSAAEVIAKHADEVPRPPSEQAPEARIPREMDAIVLKALAKRSEDRYQTMAELSAALLALSGAAVPASSTPSRARRPRSRSQGGLAPVLAGLALCAAVVTPLWISARQHVLQRPVVASTSVAPARVDQHAPSHESIRR